MDFPETRILEETMNVMLLDTRANTSVQEHELIEATSSSNGSCQCSCSSQLQWCDLQSDFTNMIESSPLENSLSILTL